MIDRSVHTVRLANQMEQLPKWHRVIFAAACAERALPGYAAYAAQSKNGDGARSEMAAMQSAVEFLWTHIGCKGLEPIDGGRHLRALEAIAEEKEIAPAPWSPWQAQALDTVYVVLFALNTLRSHDAQNATETANRLIETVFHFVETKEQIEIVSQIQLDQIERHPLVQLELERQQRDVSRLLDLRDADPQELAARLRVDSNKEMALPI